MASSHRPQSEVPRGKPDFSFLIPEQEAKLLQLNVDAISSWSFNGGSIVHIVIKKLRGSQYQSDTHSKIQVDNHLRSQ
jgi:hypothetical protein